VDFPEAPAVLLVDSVPKALRELGPLVQQQPTVKPPLLP
jgi:hypothetical protein